ncbi:MAG: hypothetical protein HYV63_31160 [Candidatus Schekmanbacteria bacterium]|nr:hypothetical protein [Candidatus Schekmanbacteria bacterium]
MSEIEWRAEWDRRTTEFAAAVGRGAADITAGLEGVVGTPSAEALSALAEGFATDDDLVAALVHAGPRIPVAIFRKHVPILRGPSSRAATAGGAAMGSGPALDVLPSVPDDESFLAALKVGGELKIGTTEVIAAMKAALANRVGLYDLPQRLRAAMESFALANDEPCAPSFYEIERLVARRSYAEVLGALGLEGTFVTVARMNQLLGRLERDLWRVLHQFQVRLVEWQKSWAAGASGPGMMVAALAALAGGGQLPAGMLQPPETASLKDAAEGVINAINKVFAGPGIPVARALAHDAGRIKQLLEDERLPRLIGASNREQMLRMLEADVTADYVRLERNVVRFALAIMELPKVTSGQSELAYLTALLQLGIAIPWEKLVPKA